MPDEKQRMKGYRNTLHKAQEWIDAQYEELPNADLPEYGAYENGVCLALDSVSDELDTLLKAKTTEKDFE